MGAPMTHAAAPQRITGKSFKLARLAFQQVHPADQRSILRFQLTELVMSHDRPHWLRVPVTCITWSNGP